MRLPFSKGNEHWGDNRSCRGNAPLPLGESTDIFARSIRESVIVGYPKTTSKKVRQVKRSKAMNGEHLGAPPFGYRKNPDDPKRWLIDEEAATIVRRIFKMAMDGCGCSAIATALWEDKVLTPSA